MRSFLINTCLLNGHGASGLLKLAYSRNIETLAWRRSLRGGICGSLLTFPPTSAHEPLLQSPNSVGCTVNTNGPAKRPRSFGRLQCVKSKRTRITRYGKPELASSVSRRAPDLQED